MRETSLFVDFVFVILPTCQNLFITPKSGLVVPSWSFVDVLRAGKMLSCQTCVFPVRCLLISSHAANKCPLHSLFSTIFTHFCVFVGDFAQAQC